MAKQVINNGTVAGDGTGEILFSAFEKTNDNFTELYDLSDVDGLVYIDSKDKLPAPVAGVITLLDRYAYYFTKSVDLLGDSITVGENTTILGTSSESVVLSSTGLTTALITGAYSLPIRFITFTADIVFDLDGTGNLMALDWMGVNFLNCIQVGTILNPGNFIFKFGAFLNSEQMSFTGNQGTISFDASLFSGRGTNDIIQISSSAVVSRRFRITESAFIVPTGSTGINVDAVATIPTESNILNHVNFSGSGT